MKKLAKKPKKTAMIGVSIFSVLSLIGLAACSSVVSNGASTKKDAQGNDLAYGVKLPDGSNDDTKLEDFINALNRNQNTKTQLFTSVQNTLYQFLYEQEQKASVDAANKYNEKSLQLETYAKRREDSQKFFDDEKKSYQQTYRERWATFWNEHLLSTYNAINEDQAIQNRTADQIKTDALRRYTLEVTGQKLDGSNYTFGDISSSFPYLQRDFNTYWRLLNTQPAANPTTGTNIEVMTTQSFIDGEKSPEDLLKAYVRTNDPLYISHFLVGIKPGTDGTATWTVTKDTLKRMFAIGPNGNPILQELQEKGIDFAAGGGTTGDNINNLAQRQTMLNQYSDNTDDKSKNGSLGNYLFENINQNLKPGFGIGLTYAMEKNNANLNSDISFNNLLPLSGIGATAPNQAKGLYQIIQNALYGILGITPTVDNPNPAIPAWQIDRLTDSDLQTIGNDLSTAFSQQEITPEGQRGLGRELAYKTDDNSGAVLISDDGIDFVNVNSLITTGTGEDKIYSPAPLNTNTVEYNSFFQSPNELLSRIRYDLQQSLDNQTLHFDIPNMIQQSLASGDLQFLPLQDALSSTSLFANGDFVTYLKGQKNFSTPNERNFNDQDIQQVKDIISNQNSASLIPKNGAIYKWISDYYDAQSTADPDQSAIDPTNFNIQALYEYIKNLDNEVE